MNKPQDRLAWLALYMIPGLGNAVLKKLIKKLGDPEAVFEASLTELMTVEGMREDIAKKIKNRSLDTEAADELRKAERYNARIIAYTDPSYPALLREIHNPPMILYVKGKEIPLKQTFISVVGSRNPTHYGRKAAEILGAGLAKRGAGVVSGLARGIDSAAHRGCLMGNGFTIAVIGTGIDVVYPASNKTLFKQIEEDGAIVSEFPTATPPEPKNFPIRNRIISGLSRGTAVVEATRNSGSLITASFALDQGREVFAVPGSIDSFKSRGTHFLIKQGAKLIENADDILEEFGFVGRGPLGKGVQRDASGTPPGMHESDKKIYEIIGDYPIHMDDIIRLGKMGAGKVAGILMKMELEGIVRQLPGKMFVR
ncbi:MAG: DNA-processing protein DprA [Proteobacteria bacterium]|nr:DNA-processing protein DprA [Pseudomonadota bacterium]MBU0990597.1 DNA-processing protein DprA [Pseudomonadota bacterium]MBU1903999.1 DNA-processing protein DprA [Pseudomonadota bacterium]